MLTDSKIIASYIKLTAHSFTRPKSRRDIAQDLRRIRNIHGKAIARLALACLSAEWLQKHT